MRSICHVVERIEAFDHLKSAISDLKSRARDVSQQLGGWTASLQASDIKGQRYLTEKSKTGYQDQKKAEVFLAELRREHEARLATLKQRRDPGDG